MLGNSNWLTIYTFLMEPIKYCMMLQKDSLVRFWLDNLPSISGSKLYIGLLPVRMTEEKKKKKRTNLVCRKRNYARQQSVHFRRCISKFTFLRQLMKKKFSQI